MVSEDKKRKNHDIEDWGYRGIARRDFRASKDGPEVTLPPRRKRKSAPVSCHKNKDGFHTTPSRRDNPYNNILERNKYYFWNMMNRRPTNYCIDCGRYFSAKDMNRINAISESMRAFYGKQRQSVLD